MKKWVIIFGKESKENLIFYFRSNRIFLLELSLPFQSSSLSLQISLMRVELQNLQPQLIQTSVETKELIAVIEKETAEVEVVKKVSVFDSRTFSP